MEEILGVVSDELDLVDSYDTDEGLLDRINAKVDEQNDLISIENYRLELIRILKEAKEMNIDINFSEEMTVEELESILSSIKM